MKKNLVFFSLTTSCVLALLISVLFMFSDGGERVEAATPPSDISGSFAEKEITYLVAAGLLDFFIPNTRSRANILQRP